MNILQITAQAEWGGGEQLVLDLSDGLTAENHHVVIASKKSKVISTKFAHFKPLYFLPLSFPTTIYSIFLLKKIIVRECIDIIHVHTFQHVFVAIFARQLCRHHPKIILTRHLCKQAKTNRLYTWLYRQLDQLVFVSHFAKNVFLSCNPRINQEKIHVIHNSINTQRATTLRSATHVPANIRAIKLGFAGSIRPEKGIEILIEAVQLLKTQLPEITLDIAGKIDSNYLSALKTLIHSKQLDDVVKFRGFHNDIALFMHSIDVGVAPSICAESFGLVILEYMLAGKPVIASNNSAQPEIITNKHNGLLVPPGNPKAIAEAVLYLANNKNSWRQLTEQAVQIYDKQFSYARFIRQYTEIFQC